MRRCCLIHLKNSSTCQRDLYSRQIVAADGANMLVKADFLMGSDSVCRLHLELARRVVRSAFDCVCG